MSKIRIKTTSSLCYPQWIKPSKSCEMLSSVIIPLVVAGFWVAILASICLS